MAYLLITCILVLFFGREMIKNKKEYNKRGSYYYKEKYQNSLIAMLLMPCIICIFIYAAFPHYKFALSGKKTVLIAEWTEENWVVKKYIEYNHLPNLNSEMVKWFGYRPSKIERVYYEVLNSKDSSKIEILKQSNHELNIIYEQHN